MALYESRFLHGYTIAHILHKVHSDHCQKIQSMIIEIFRVRLANHILTKKSYTQAEDRLIFFHSSIIG
jgi:hypothetical protein